MLVPACEDDSGARHDKILTALSIAPEGATVTAGSMQAFEALAAFSDASRSSVTESAGWASSDPSVATIDSRGRAQAKAPGRTVVSASFGGLSAMTTLNVTSAALLSVAVQLEVPSAGPFAASLPSGTEVALRAIGTYADESTADLTAQAEWSSSVEAIASVSNAAGQRGRVKGASPGVATIVAAVGGVSGSAEVEVTSAVLQSIVIDQGDVINAPGGTRKFTAHGILSDGRMQALGVEPTWSVGPGAAVTIDEDGLATVVGPLGAQQAIVAKLAGTELSATVQLYVRRYVYVSTNRSGALAEQESTARRGISSYTASDTDGALAEIPNSFVMLNGDDSAFAGAVHPSGRFVYFPTTAGHAFDADYRVWDAASGRLEVYRVDPLTGRLSSVQTIQLDAGGADAAIDPSGRFLVVIANRTTAPNKGAGLIILYRIDGVTGRLSEIARRTGVSGASDRASLRQVTFNPVRPYVYVSSNDGGSSASAGVFAMTYGDAGLAPVAGANPYQDADPGISNFIDGIAAHPSGKFVFATNLSTAGGYVAGIAVDGTTGALSNVNHLIATAINVRRAEVDPSGENLYVAALNGLRHYRIDAATGAVAEAAEPLYAAPSAAISRDVTVDPIGRFLYLATSFRAAGGTAPGYLLSYKIGAGGALTETGQLSVSSFGVVTSP